LNLSTEFTYALGAMLCYGAADLIYKRAATAGVRPHHFLMVQAWLFAPAMGAYALATGALHAVPAAGWGMAAGLCVFYGLYNFSRSLRDGAVSVNAPIFRLNFTLTVALAVTVLGEPLGPMKIAGLALALVAVWLLLGGSGSAGTPGVSRGSLMRVILATIAMGIANFCYKLGVMYGATPATMVVAQASVFFPLATVFGYLPERKFNPPAATWPYAACAALLLGFAFVLLATSLVSGQASVLVPVAQMGFVITAAAGILALGERTSARRIAGLVIAVGALVCLAVS
jgi:drug/metabolite transporter (DMT)-like permease